MATRLVKNLRNDYLSCPVCLEQFKTPKTLPCEHAFCEPCLIGHVKQTLNRGRFQCPVCRENIRIEDSYLRDIDKWVQTLPTDALLSSLVDTLVVHEGRNPEYEYSGAISVCAQHKKPQDAFCFEHSQLICWECAAREHRQCDSIDSAKKAGHVIPTMAKTLKTKIEGHLRKARILCNNDQTFAKSKLETSSELDRLEKNLDAVYMSAKKQVSLLRENVEVYNRHHLEQRTRFYDLVKFLLDMNCTLETLDESADTVTAISVLEKLKQGAAIADGKMAVVESSMAEGSLSKLSFILDDGVDEFLRTYSSVGFIDVGSPPEAETGRCATAPPSIAHILQRTPRQANVDEGNSNS